MALPSSLLKLDSWYITLPCGKDDDPDTVRQPLLNKYFHPQYFFIDRDHVVFRVHAGGATTKGSGFARSELREMDRGGVTPAAWGTADKATHSLTLEAAVSELPSKRPCVCIAQVHDDKSDLVMVRVNANQVQLVIDGKQLTVLDASYRLGSRVSVRLTVNQQNLQLSYSNRANGVSKSVSARLPVRKRCCYFKAGAYIQTSPKKYSEKPTATAVVRVYALTVDHSDRQTKQSLDSAFDTLSSHADATR